MNPTPIDPPGRTFTVACPFCSVDVVTKPRAIRVDAGLRELLASVDLFAAHSCAPADRTVGAAEVWDDTVAPDGPS